MAAMVFAAGFGTRMGNLTKDQPKPMISVAGRPLIDHALDLIRHAGCAPIIANLHYRANVLERHLAGTGVQTILEAPDILDTGGGLRNALPLLGSDPVFTVNSDAVWSGPNPLTLLRQAWKPEKMDALLICIPPEHAAGHQGAGDFVQDEEGRLNRGPGMIYGGMQIIKTDLLADVPEKAFSLNVIWNRMLAKRRLFGLTYPGMWCDVGHPAGIKIAEKMLENANV